MKILLLIRHAKSSWKDPGMPDFNRPLDERGLKDADKMAVHLLTCIHAIDAIITSPAVRAKATAVKFLSTYKMSPGQLITEQALYLAPAHFFNQLINSVNNNFNTVAIFAHNPGITDFVNTLTSAIKTDNVPTCGIFAVKADIESWKNFASASKELLMYDYPKLHS